MPKKPDPYARRTLDFVERLQSLSEYDDICREIVNEMEWFGFTNVTDLTIPGPADLLVDGIVMNTRPAEYVGRYVEQNYVVRDPVVRELRETVNTYSWSDVRRRRDLSKADVRIMDEAREFDVRDGLTVPIVTPGPGRSQFSAPAGPIRTFHHGHGRLSR